MSNWLKRLWDTEKVGFPTSTGGEYPENYRPPEAATAAHAGTDKTGMGTPAYKYVYPSEEGPKGRLTIEPGRHWIAQDEVPSWYKKGVWGGAIAPLARNEQGHVVEGPSINTRETTKNTWGILDEPKFMKLVSSWKGDWFDFPMPGGRGGGGGRGLITGPPFDFNRQLTQAPTFQRPQMREWDNTDPAAHLQKPAPDLPPAYEPSDRPPPPQNLSPHLNKLLGQ